MEQNKLNLEDCCLTIEQTKELQALGIDFSRALMYYDAYNNNMKLWERDMKLYESDGEPIREVKDGIFIPTFTNTEMLEMLPKEIDGYKLTFVYDYFRNGDDKYYIGYLKTYSAPLKELESTLLRNSLFGMIKWLKTNKLI